jgi:hypothetical protein
VDVFGKSVVEFHRTGTRKILNAKFTGKPLTKDVNHDIMGTEYPWRRTRVAET